MGSAANGAIVGAAQGGLGYLAGLMEQGSGWGRTGNGLLTGMAGKTVSAFIPQRDQERGAAASAPSCSSSVTVPRKATGTPRCKRAA